MAKVNEIINRIRMQATSEGIDKTTQDLKGLSAAHGEAAKSADVLATTTETSAKKQLSALKPFEARERRLIGAAKAEFEFAQTLKTADRALDQNVITQRRYDEVLREQAVRYNAVTQAAERTAAANKKLAESAVFKQTIFPDRRADFAAAAADADKLKASLVPLWGIGQEYRKEIERINEAQKRGIITQQQATAAIQTSRAATGAQVQSLRVAHEQISKYAGGTGLARFELINLSRQVQDVGVSLASGQSPFMVLIQQGSQIADIFASSGATMASFWGQVKSIASTVFTPIRLATAGIVSLGIAGVTAAIQFGSSQNDIQRALLGIGKASGVTLKDINRIGKEASSAFGLSRSEAEGFAVELAKTGRIGVEAISELTIAGKDFARLLGVDAADAAKILAQAMTDPGAMVELNKRLGIMDAGMERQVENLMRQNKLIEAQRLLLPAINKEVQQVNATVGTSANLWTAVGNTISDLWKSFSEGAANVTGIGLVPGLEDQLKSAEQRLANLVHLSKLPFGDTWKKDIERTIEDIDKLKTKIADIPKAAAETQLKLESTRAVGVVEAVLPDLKGIQAAQNALTFLEDTLKRIRTELEKGGESPLLKAMGMELKTIELAARAAAEAVQTLQENMAQSERRLGRREEARAGAAPGIGGDIAMQLRQMDDQLKVAEAVTGQERMRAQEVATTNRLLDEGRSIEEATAVAGKEREITQAAINSSAKLTLLGLQDQFAIASAVTGQERMRAQEVATTNRLIREGVDAQLAGAIAAQERANAEAQINAQAEKTLAALQDQNGVITAVGGKAKMRAQAEATYNGLVREGVDSGKAAAIAEQERKNAQAQLNGNALEMLHTLEDQAYAAAAVTAEEKAMGESQATFNKLLREGVDYLLAEKIAAQQLSNAMASIAAQEERAARARTSSGGYGYKGESGGDYGYKGSSKPITGILTEHGRMIQKQLDAGLLEIDPEAHWSMPFRRTVKAITQDWENSILRGGTSVADALSGLISGGRLPTGQLDQQQELQEFRQRLIDRLLNLLPEENQIPHLKKLLEQAKQQPATLAREELIKSLTDKIEGLKDSTDSLNDTMGQILSPYYSQDPRTTKLGFRAGSVGNADWLTGATNQTALDTILGKGATAPGGITIDAPGGVTITGPGGGGALGPGGVVIPGISPSVGSGGTGGNQWPGGIVTPGIMPTGTGPNPTWGSPTAMQKGGPIGFGATAAAPAPTVVHNDNRIIIQGSVDQDTLSKLKVSQYQQTQRIRSKISAA